jgi:hypothetical protein
LLKLGAEIVVDQGLGNRNTVERTRREEGDDGHVADGGGAGITLKEEKGESR